MRLAIVSDTHLGFARGSSREGDAYLALKQALEGIASQNVDAIIHPGDLFDHKIPTQEVWNECFDLLSILQKGKNPGVKIIHQKRDNSSKEFFYQGIPLIAIAGTHEYRSKDLKNALQVLETGNFLICLHASHALIEKKKENGEIEKVAVHGMSGIPEKRALEALKMYHPQPVSGVHNLLVLHQSIKEFLPSKDDMVATIGLENLPNGFDLMLNGHLHWTSLTEWEGKRLLIPGSTIFTQMKNLEGKKPKGWYVYDTQTRELTMHHLPVQRKLFYHKLKFKDATPQKILKVCREVIEKDLVHAQHAHTMLPLYRLKVTGTLAKGFTQADVDLSPLLKEFESKAHFSPSKKFSTGTFAFRLDELRALHKSNVSISRMGIDLLEKNLQQTLMHSRMDVKRLFELLEDKENIEKVVQLLHAGEIVSREIMDNDSISSKGVEKLPVQSKLD
ncbi:MAG: hypothetical protein FJY86_03045 [Candidatus Diapherotrites archaeon]|uniref:Calcineurin-like phosphoesterase domain-containing protein n=1 Tax=Candidatus Iainarchaeum sp. TaxID=3101447 RepID=A0A8T4C794_9ARCH|nr:hypothetical protein [Candidatus Diapherotrites archaeon]